MFCINLGLAYTNHWPLRDEKSYQHKKIVLQINKGKFKNMK
jgi:hypothetical protein